MFKQPALFENLTASYNDSSLVITESNKAVIEWLDNWPIKHKLIATYLVGPKKSGKKLIASLWAKKNNALLFFLSKKNISLTSIQAIDQSVAIILPKRLSDEEEIFLFHLFNHLKNNKHHILFISEHKINPNLADLKSRMLTASMLEILPPDEEMLKALYFKYFHDFGININMEVINFLMTHFDRSYEVIFNLSKKLNDLSVLEKKTITIPFIKKYSLHIIK
jgi:chromosomal replication initiation ATPase DnaA